MPVIPVYKHRGTIIPVQNARKAQAYQCPWTGKIVATKRAYVKHLQQLRTTRMHSRAKQIRWQRLGEDLWNQTSFENIVQWVELHPEWFLDNAKNRGFHNERDRFDQIRSEFSIRITYLDLKWSNNISNSHSCPRTGVTNWMRSNDKPLGYPGWTGRIEYVISHELPGFGDLFRGIGINTGTGGGDGTKYGYDVRFFADDWPGLSKGQTWATLKGTQHQPVKIGKSRLSRD
jgi:hypothetical protein